jgi:hypothetical protein
MHATNDELFTLFAWLINHQSSVFFSENKSTTNNTAVLFSQNKLAPTTDHQPNQHTVFFGSYAWVHPPSSCPPTRIEMYILHCEAHHMQANKITYLYLL